MSIIPRHQSPRHDEAGLWLLAAALATVDRGSDEMCAGAAQACTSQEEEWTAEMGSFLRLRSVHRAARATQDESRLHTPRGSCYNNYGG